MKKIPKAEFKNGMVENIIHFVICGYPNAHVARHVKIKFTTGIGTEHGLYYDKKLGKVTGEHIIRDHKVNKGKYIKNRTKLAQELIQFLIEWREGDENDIAKRKR